MKAKGWTCNNFLASVLPLHKCPEEEFISLNSSQQIISDTECIPSCDFTHKCTYYSPLAEEIPSNKSHSKVAHINANRLLTKSKLQEIQILLETTMFDLLGISASKLTRKNEDTYPVRNIYGTAASIVGMNVTNSHCIKIHHLFFIVLVSRRKVRMHQNECVFKRKRALVLTEPDKRGAGPFAETATGIQLKRS